MSEGGTPVVAGGQTSIGVDVGGTKIAAGLIDAAGNVLAQRRRPTRPAHLVDDIEAMCRELAAQAHNEARALVGIGVGLKGAVDRTSRRLVHSFYLGQADLPIGDMLAQALGVPTWLENDVHAATIGEMIFGAGRDFSDFVLFNAGTGIAVGIVVGGQLHRGSSGVAGENGHVSMDQSGRFPCPCGLSGCMETIILRSRTGTPIPVVADAARLGTSPGPAFGYVLAGLVDIVNLLNPRAIVLAGGMVDAPSVIAWLDTSVRRLAPEASAGLDRVVAAHGGADTGILGAGALPFHAMQLRA
jgi:glucokinase